MDFISARRLPPLRSREEMKTILLENEYGFLPDTDINVTYGAPSLIERRFDCGKASFSKLDMTFSSRFSSHTFPLYVLAHKDGKKHPFFVFLNIHSDFPSYYFPIEEIAERGFDVFGFGYKDVSSDDGDFSNGLAGVFYGSEGRKNPSDAGKIRIWAYAASRVLDYALSLPSSDPERSAVVGHSRLGKTALVAGMTDERFRFVCSNDSGCSGASLSRGNTGVIGTTGPYGNRGETIRDITKHFPFWFCENYFRFTGENVPDIFDQHWLIASSAPRYVCVSSADMDDWADPVSEYSACIAASEAWEKNGLPGFVHPDRLPVPGEKINTGSISYFLRHGAHFLSRHDWNAYMDFMETK